MKITASASLTLVESIDMPNVDARQQGGLEVIVGRVGNASQQMMRQVAPCHRMVPYLGVYDFLPREVPDFRIRAWPQGADSSIELSFTDRLGRQ